VKESHAARGAFCRTVMDEHPHQVPVKVLLVGLPGLMDLIPEQRRLV